MTKRAKKRWRSSDRRMISEKRAALIEAASWEKRRTPCSSTNSSPTTSSLKDRMAALTKSSETWQTRVRKDEDLSKLNPSARRKQVTVHPGKENVAHTAEELPPSKVALLLSLDKGLETFFPQNAPTASTSAVEMDLDAVEKTDILITPRRPRPQKASRGRPKDVRLNAIDTTSIQIAEDPRDHVDPIVFDADDDSPVAKSAKAGLSEVEDYSAAKGALKEVDTTSPYPDKMLIRVKGEKKMDVRLVAPVAASVHQSAVFILVTPNRLLKYEGENSNILERTKAAQICINITTKSDLCCSAKTVENCSGSTSFFRLLGGGSPGDEPPLPVEHFENLAAKLNLVIRVTDDYKIQSVSKGERVRFCLLQPKDTLIFDFGTEIYVWSGRLARKTTGRYAVEYAQQLRTKPVPFSEGILGSDFSNGRPEWILYRRLVQGIQDTLFSSKFSDWQTRETKGLGSPMTPRNFVASPTTSRNENQEARLLAKMLKSLQHPEPMTILEDQEITRTMKDVVTESIKFWQLHNEQLQEIPSTNVFLNDQCYVVRWQYRIQVSGVRRLKTGEEHEKETGRERVAYFYWLGGRTTPKQQGLCALKLSHMDKEKRPHLRISQRFETPLFLQLFGGKLIIRSSSDDSVPIFLVRGGTQLEGHAAQLDDIQPLRAHAVYIQLEQRKITLIAGTNCEEISVKNGLALCDEIRLNGKELGIEEDAEIVTSVQGDDSSFTWLTTKGRTTCPRFYRIYETEADELHCPQFNKQLSFPFPQEKLTDTILVDIGEKLWIWSEKAPTTFSLRVAEHFWQERRGEATVVLKGNEPEQFVAIFDSWKDWEMLEEDKTPPTPPRKLEELMVERTQTYSLTALRTRKGLPEGIDTKNLEQYLSEDEFQSAFNMDRSSFDALPAWKQIRLRKEAGLF